MKHASVLRCGGLAAIAVGGLNLLVAATHFMMPRAQLRGAAGFTAPFFESLARGSAVFQIHYWLVVALALLSFAVIAAFFSLLREERTGAVCWGVTLGFFGAALTAVDFAEIGVQAPRLAAVFTSTDPAARPLLIALGVPHADPCFFAYGLLAGFALIINAAALRYRRLPRLLGCLGLAGGAMYLLVFAGSLTRVPLIIDIAVGLGGVVIGPLWYIWSGFVLISKSKK